ncbi:MAG: glutamyl-tRNA reductase [Cyclobacteriaceae bacterium]
MHKDFKALGISYKDSPLEVREMLSFDEGTAKQLLQKLSDALGLTEALIVSTCNRTEVYYSSSVDLFDDILGVISVQKGTTSQSISQFFKNYPKAQSAIDHLFNVSIGLEAQVVGDLQIINQVKNAYQWSVDEDMAGPFLHRLMHTIFFTNKRIVQETPFRDGAASVSYATVELIKGLVQNIERPKILVLGTGEIGEDVAKNLSLVKNAHVWLSNRTTDKAEQLAAECGYEAVDFSNIKQFLPQVDVVISSIQNETPSINKEMLSTGEPNSFKYLFDLSVPRSITNDVEEIPGVLLYNIDSIQSKTSKALERRLKAIPEVKSIIKSSIKDLKNWSSEMEVSPTINKLKNALEEIRKEEISRYLRDSNQDENAVVDKITKGMVQKIIKLPVLQLKAACKRGEAETLIDVLNDLFDLERQSESLKK